MDGVDLDKIIGYGEMSWAHDEYGPHVVFQIKQDVEGTLKPITMGDLFKFMHND